MSMYSLKLRRRLHYTNCLFKKLRQIFAQHLSIDIIIIVASLFGFTSEFYGAHKYEPAWWSKNKLKMKLKLVGGAVERAARRWLKRKKNKNATSVLFAQN